jgi:acetyl-CoA carboxylase biotin carboxyl carrier protein
LDQQVKINSNAIRSLAELLKEMDLTEIEYQVDSVRIKVSRIAQQGSITAQAQYPAKPIEQGQTIVTANTDSKFNALENHPGVIEAQMVGTVYLSPGPNAAPFVTVGEAVSQGQTLFIIEAMKVMNLIKAPRTGIVRHIFVKDSQPVEYGDPIIIIE